MSKDSKYDSSRVTFPIAVKLGLFTLVLLFTATVPTFLENAREYELASSTREKQFNRSSAIGLAEKAERIIWQYVDKTKLIGGMLIELNDIDPSNFDKLNRLTFEGSREITAVEVWERRAFGSKPFRKVDHILNHGKKIYSAYPMLDINRNRLPKKLKYAYNLTDEVLAQNIFEIESTFSGEIQVKNVSFLEDHLMLLVAAPVKKDSSNRITHIAISYIQPDRLIKIVQNNDKNRKLFLVDNDGKILVDAEENRMVNPEDLSDAHVLVKKALSSIEGEAQAVYQDYKTGKGEMFIGDFARNSLGILAISQVPESVITKPIRKAKRSAVFMTGLVFCVAFFFIFVFAITLTNPIEKLFRLTELVAKGDFSVRARRHINSHDEVGQLALAFDKMTKGLAERQKMESVLHKFHGSDIAEKLVRSKLELGGERKEVIIFFSDIRNFTQFSELRSPEEVVDLLNEYFDIIVKVIDRNGGIVDKFIGDSVMGVWGLDDEGNIAERAIRACLELRIAFNRLNKRREEEGKEPVYTGMGLHAGFVIAGTIGSEDRMEYTVIGDAVNTASRIETATKMQKVDLLVSDSVLKMTNNRFVSEKITDVQLAGKAEVLSLYEIIGYVNEKGEEIKVYNDFPLSNFDEKTAV